MSGNYDLIYELLLDVDFAFKPLHVHDIRIISLFCVVKRISYVVWSSAFWISNNTSVLSCTVHMLYHQLYNLSLFSSLNKNWIIGPNFANKDLASNKRNSYQAATA